MNGPLRSNLLTTLAALEQSRRRMPEAESHIRRALALNPGRGDREAVDLGRASLLVTLGSIQYERGDLKAALGTFEEGLLAIAPYPQARVSRLALLGWLGISNDRLNRPEVAIEMLRQAVTAAEALYPRGHARTSGAHGNLGAALAAYGRLDEAEKSLGTAMTILDALPDANPQLRQSHQLKLARLALQREDLERARTLVTAHLDGQAKHFGVDHERLLPGHLVRASLELLARRPADALRAAEHVLTVLDSAKRQADPMWSQATLLAARAQAQLGQTHAAQELLTGALAALGSAHAENPRVLGPLLELEADALTDLGRPDEALASYRRALSLYDQSLDKQHPARGRCLLRIAALLPQSEAVEPAARMQEAATILRANLVTNAPTLSVLARLSATEARRGVGQ